MRNYANKSNKKMTRYRTPSSFKARSAEGAKKAKVNPPYQPPGRGHKTNVGRA